MYVVDSSSLLEIEEYCHNDAPRTLRVLDFMFTLSAQGQLGFPPCVPSGCRDFDEVNVAATWAGPTHASLSVKSVPHARQADVLAICPAILDDLSDDEEQPQVELLGYALHFHAQDPVTVVTEDVLDLPYRSSIASAAQQLGMGSMRVNEFITKYSL
ncbi:hypothetical protein [Frigoribacterium salinisoli]